MSPSASDLIAFGCAAADEGLLVSTCGNASLRLDAERILVSASGSELRALTAGDVATLEIATGRHIDGPRPSVEADLHRRIYMARPAAGAVLHCQSRAATVLACRRNPPDDLNYIPEIAAYVRKHARVPYSEPGSESLAAEVAQAFQDPDVTLVQMTNHGQVIAGGTWKKAIRRALFFELACWMSLQANDLTTLPREAVLTLRRYGRDV